MNPPQLYPSFRMSVATSVFQLDGSLFTWEIPTASIWWNYKSTNWHTQLFKALKKIQIWKLLSPFGAFWISSWRRISFNLSPNTKSKNLVILFSIPQWNSYSCPFCNFTVFKQINNSFHNNDLQHTKHMLTT